MIIKNIFLWIEWKYIMIKKIIRLSVYFYKKYNKDFKTFKKIKARFYEE